jgi:hypothetical protein
MMDTVVQDLLKNGRKWVTVVLDGSPWVNCFKLAQHRSIRLRVGPLHEEINMIRAATDMLYPILGKSFAQSQGYTSPKALESVLLKKKQ